MKDDNCIFCKVDSKEFNGKRLVYKNENIVIFLSISPTKPGHVLIIPSDHFETIWETPDELLKDIILYVKKMALIVKEVTKADGINIGVNNGKAAGQEIKHVHFHVVPRHFGDGLKLMPPGEISEEELIKYTESIKERFFEKYL